MLAPNLSATLLALQGLAAAGRSSGAASALPFLAQCQNFSATREDFDDGGFFFAPPIRCEIKRALPGAMPRAASATILMAAPPATVCSRCTPAGVAPESPRFQSCCAWLLRHAAGATHGGTWAPGRASERESLRYYHAQAFAGVLATAAPPAHLETWAADQRALLTTDLLAAQAPDGSWTNAYADSFEDDPIVAMAFAMRALQG